MSEEKTETKSNAPTPGVLKAKLQAIREHFNKFIGKEGMNPFFMLNGLDSLEKRLEKEGPTPEIVAAIGAIKFEEPKVCAVSEKPKVNPAKEAPVASGLKLPQPKQ